MWLVLGTGAAIVVGAVATIVPLRRGLRAFPRVGVCGVGDRIWDVGRAEFAQLIPLNALVIAVIANSLNGLVNGVDKRS